MNRTAVLCAVGLALLTLAAFVDHVRSHELPGREPPEEAALVPAAPSMPLPPATARAPAPPPVDLAALRDRVRAQVLEPLRSHRLRLSSFSRVRLPDPVVELEMEETVRAPKESGPTFVYFRVFERRERRRQGPRPRARRQLALGRIDPSTGSIELAPGPVAAAQGATFESLATALARLGVRPDGRGKRPW